MIRGVDVPESEMRALQSVADRTVSVVRRVLMAVACTACACTVHAHEDAATTGSKKAATHFTVPGQITPPDGRGVRYENGFLLVPENRANPHSRLIAVRYLRFPAKSSGPARPPVVMLPGGPGDSIEEPFVASNPWLLMTIERVTRTADFIIMQQRGAPTGAYTSKIMAKLTALPLSEPRTDAAERKRLQDAIAAALPLYSSMGFDLRGYDVRQMVEDIEALRTTLGYEQIVVQGQSYGSQWGMAYLKLHGRNVARALFTGFEPLDYGWDSPGALWETYQRIARRAEADSNLKRALPAGGLIAAYQEVVRRLERSPQIVKIVDPSTNTDASVTVGADDLRYLRTITKGSRRESVEAWPKFVLELYAGDYRLLALAALEQRRATEDNLLGLLVDSGLGITPARERELDGEKDGLRWLGDPNADYHTVRGLLPTADVGDAFRADFDISVPTLVVHGDADLSTPLPNALSQKPRLKNGRLVVVQGGTHAVRIEMLSGGLVPEDRGFVEQYLAFLAGDAPGGAAAALQSMPQTVRLTDFSFQRADAPSLYEQRRAASSRPK